MVNKTVVSTEPPSLQIKLDDFTLWGTEIKDALARADIKGEVV